MMLKLLWYEFAFHITEQKWQKFEQIKHELPYM